MARLQKSFDFINSWKFIDKGDGQILSDRPTKEAWLITLNSWLGIVQTLCPSSNQSPGFIRQRDDHTLIFFKPLQPDFNTQVLTHVLTCTFLPSTYILTRRLNQDFLENYFALLRRRTFNGGNLTASSISQSFGKLYFIQSFDHSSGTNCEEDTSTSLYHYISPPQPYAPTITTADNDILALSMTIIFNDDAEAQGILDWKKNPDAISYTTGYIINRILPLLNNCKDCFSSMTTDTIRPDLELTRSRIYAPNCKLHFPSIQMSNACMLSVQTIFDMFSECGHKQGVKKILTAFLAGKLDFAFIHEPHRSSVKEKFISLVVNTFTHYYIKRLNLDILQ